MDRNGEAAILKCLGPGLHHVIDVGANIGKWTEAVLNHAPSATCVMFEPSRLALAELRKLYGSSPRVVIRPVAVADSPGKLTFYEEAAQGETSSLVQKAAAATATPCIVEITTLDCEMERLRWKLVDYLKIDAEGYDFHVLRGARRSFEQKQIALGQFEYGHAWMLSGSTLTGALEWLKGLGYESFLLKSGRLYIPRPDFYGEYFGYSNYVFCHRDSKSLISHLIAGTI